MPASIDYASAMPNSRDTPSTHPLTRVLWFNGIALLVIATALLLRGGGDLLPANSASAQVPIAGGGGIYLMPGQLSNSMWGTYLMDVDAQTLMVYHYDAASRKLELLAARDFTHDRQLPNFNTQPAPEEVKAIVEKARQDARVAPRQ